MGQIQVNPIRPTRFRFRLSKFAPAGAVQTSLDLDLRLCLGSFRIPQGAKHASVPIVQCRRAVPAANAVFVLMTGCHVKYGVSDTVQNSRYGGLTCMSFFFRHTLI